jgi:iron complex outermembrane receptor protein
MKTLFKTKRTKTVLFTISLFLLANHSFSQNPVKGPIQDSTHVNQLDEVLVSAVRVTSKTPVSFSNMSKAEIQWRNLGQDIPILMNYLPSVVTTSDAGNCVGYTGIRVRGSDATRVNVTINGIPYNDAESSGTFFVDMPDFASSVESLQLQRGVGTSTNGSGAFGASLNLLTDKYSKEAKGEISNSYGSFATHKHTVKFSTGLLNDHFELAGRLSTIGSQGYIDRASSDLKSYFLHGTYVGKTTLIKALVFGGTEKTYQSWYGVDSEMLHLHSTFNYAGMYVDANGDTQFYDNQTDNYQQDHAQLHWNEQLSDSWSTTMALHYTKGKGYYEEYQNAQDFADYGLDPITINGTLINQTDLIRQKWLDNDFYGTTFSANYKKDKWDVVFGGSWNRYEGLHYGKVIWARYASNSELGNHYYDDFATKTDGTLFAKANYQLSTQWSLFWDLQYRNVTYKANGVQPELVNDSFAFFNPKTGITFKANDSNTFYFSYARANREPNRTDYEGGNVTPEKLDDYEWGWRYVAPKVTLNANVYCMMYKDQLILTGNLDDVGNPIRSNSDQSYRLGLEVDATIKLTSQWYMKPNMALSQNKNRDVKAVVNGTLEYYGKNDIAYSPNVIAGNMLIYKPNDAIQVAYLTKFVGRQYMNNRQSPEAKLPDYCVSDFTVTYEYKPKSVFKSVLVTGMISNIFDKEYCSNGYMYDVYPYYYPQAGMHFLAGVTLKF